jgi:exosome complex component RRP42
MGSCRLHAGDTDIIVGVKCEMVAMKPGRARPDAGHFQIVVECAASVSKALVDDRWAGDDWGRDLSAMLEALCAGDDVIDRRALCVAPGAFAWEVYVDVLILASGGNLLDSVSLALCAALSETLLPKVEVEEAMEEGEAVQLKVDDRPEMGTPFPMKKTPLCVTVAQINGQYLFDVTPEEEACSDATICVVVDAKSGNIIGLHKLGSGLFNMASLPSMLERCRATAAALIQQLDREVALQ